MSCSEVMYQTYYPYLYQRPGGAPVHPSPRAGPFSSPFVSAAHQYDRFAAQRLQDSSSVAAAAAHSSLYLPGGAPTSSSAASSAAVQPGPHAGPHSSAGSVSSTGGISPTSPHRGKEEECSLHGRESAEAQRLQDSSSVAAAAAHSSLYLPGGAPTSSSAASSAAVQPGPHAGPHSSAGSVSSTGGISPTSPHRGKEEECSLHGRESAEVTHHGPGASLEDSDSDEDTSSSRAQYVSANCVVFTHYQGDAASQVDEHFSKALDKTTPQAKESSPMTSRAFPPSFWNSHYQPLPANLPSSSTAAHHSELYSSEHYHPGEWYHGYSAAATAAHYHQQHHHMAGYSGLLLPGRGLHVPAHAHAQCKAVDWHQGVDYGGAYPGMTAAHHSELYSSEHYHPGEWYHGYSAAATAAHYHQQHHHMAGYSGLLLPGRGLHVPAHAHAQCKAVDWHQGVDYGGAYPGMTAAHHSELYSSEHYHPGEWYHGYSAAATAAHYHQQHHHMAGYSGLLLPGRGLHVPAHAHAQCKAVDWHQGVDYGGAYPGMTAVHHSELYSSEHYHPGEWYHGYSAAATAAHYHQQHHHMAGYSGLLLPGRGLHVPAHAHAQCKAVDWHQGVDYGGAYPGMTGLEAQVQESSKDLYWF